MTPEQRMRLVRAVNAWGGSVGFDCIESAVDKLIADAVAAEREQTQELYRHNGTGGLYAMICTATRESDGELLVVYRSLSTDVRWVRPATEFNDGRFERMLTIPAAIRTAPKG